MQTAFDDFNSRDAALVERQKAAITDAQRIELERMRRILLVKLEATIQREYSNEFDRGECETVRQKRAA
ncbi:hypothetical protein ACNJYA_11080 [Bradyrhizobium sp. DASA03068]|uniref:hypothetical protein n=1 Tax=Bradyrhizobium sp. BLXBL-01 TaxID=3395915 RepID=UPI003F719E0A